MFVPRADKLASDYLQSGYHQHVHVSSLVIQNPPNVRPMTLYPKQNALHSCPLDQIMLFLRGIVSRCPRRLAQSAETGQDMSPSLLKACLCRLCWTISSSARMMGFLRLGLPCIAGDLRHVVVLVPTLQCADCVGFAEVAGSGKCCRRLLNKTFCTRDCEESASHCWVLLMRIAEGYIFCLLTLTPRVTSTKTHSAQILFHLRRSSANNLWSSWKANMTGNARKHRNFLIICCLKRNPLRAFRR